ncbi:hypothetical protein [Azonexus sp.]|jgi:hypothetical protein|uniref:hypothetical protein n=1 Tax=Azonexus sp. TaxID=1872668 RepID=UPI002838FA24|nr:hypothetical protein [Azonexus sp.]MDR1994455.1 hypothetical protein [Azonexus sp.]
MQAAVITKYHFRIRTRNGVVVESLSFFGRDEVEAQQKLRRIYRDCEILQCREERLPPGGRGGHLNYEDVVDLITTA